MPRVLRAGIRQQSGCKMSYSYFVVMIEYPRGREAIVDPEVTRREVVSRIRSREYDPERICFIHYIACGEVDDVTADVIAEAELANANDTAVALGDWTAADRQAQAFDRTADHRKNYEGM